MTGAPREALGVGWARPIALTGAEAAEFCRAVAASLADD